MSKYRLIKQTHADGVLRYGVEYKKNFFCKWKNLYIYADLEKAKRYINDAMAFDLASRVVKKEIIE